MRGAVISLFASMGLLFCASTVYAEVRCSDLIESASEFDSEIVEFRGELVGDLFDRGDHSWINLYDGSAAIGVWVPSEFLPEDTLGGSWKTSGDMFLVRGEFHRACLRHGGDLDVHALSIERVARARAKTRAVESWRRLLALGSSLAAILAALYNQRNKDSAKGSAGHE